MDLSDNGDVVIQGRWLATCKDLMLQEVLLAQAGGFESVLVCLDVCKDLGMPD